MLKKLQVLAVLMCTLSYAAAGTVSIGTASARGDMRVDSYMVTGNATLFDGSVVETGKATADLRLNKGTEITMGAGSRGTLYRDRLVLERGASELSASTPFQVQAIGLRVVASEANSRGSVVMVSGNTVEVAALTGSFGITNSEGLTLASVRPGHPLSFAIDAGQTATVPAVKSEIKVTGTIGKLEDGTFTITFNGTTYQVVGKDLTSLVGQTAKLHGTVLGSLSQGITTGQTPADGLPLVFQLSGKNGGVLATGAAAGTAGAVAGAAAGVGAGVGLSTAAIVGISIGAATGIGLGVAAGTGAIGGKGASTP